MPIVGHETRSQQLGLGLLEQIRRQATDPNLHRLIGWLAETLDGHVTLTGPKGQLLAQSSDQACAALAPAAHERSRVAAGELKSAVLDDGPLKARLLAIGPHAPHAVLAAARTEPYCGPMAETVGHVADLLALLLPTAELKAGWCRLQQAATDLFLAIFQLLMAGQVSAARRSVASVAPQALTDDTIRLYIVDCRAGNRDRTAEVIEAAIHDAFTARKGTKAGRGPAFAQGVLVVRCPAYDNHLIVVAPAGNDPTSPDRSAPVGDALRRVVADQPGHYLGASETTALARTADAYRDASRALIVAEHVPERTWQYNGRSQIAAVLDGQAFQWAEMFLQPLSNVPSERDQLIGTLCLGLTFPAGEAAAILDVHRNTIASRFKRAADLLELDLGDIRGRAVLDLALQIEARAASIHPAPPHDGTASLEGLLSTCTVRTWAEMTLAPLDGDHRDLRRTLRAWLAHNTNADGAAAELGVHPQTIRGHLRAAERLLQRTLLAGAAGAHDLVIALFVTGDIPTLPPHVPPVPQHSCSAREARAEESTRST